MLTALYFGLIRTGNQPHITSYQELRTQRNNKAQAKKEHNAKLVVTLNCPGLLKIIMPFHTQNS
jgi:hypothetical protein